MSPKSKKLLAPALSLSLLAAAFTFSNDGIVWLWSAQPGVAVALVVAAAVLWTLLALAVREGFQRRA